MDALESALNELSAALAEASNAIDEMVADNAAFLKRMEEIGGQS